MGLKVTGLLKENVSIKIKIFVIRESSLCNDQDLLADFAIEFDAGYQVSDGRHRNESGS